MIDSEDHYTFTKEDEELLDLIGEDSLSADELDNPWDVLVKKGIVSQREADELRNSKNEPGTK